VSAAGFDLMVMTCESQKRHEDCLWDRGNELRARVTFIDEAGSRREFPGMSRHGPSAIFKVCLKVVWQNSPQCRQAAR